MNELKQKKNKPFFLYICLCVCVIMTLAFKWPVRMGRVTSTFAESRGDHFHDGVDVVSPDKTVHPVAEGKLLYCWDRALFPFDHYPGGGNYKIIAHKDGLYSIYMHLRDGTIPADEYTESKPLGAFGNTGHSYSAHLHFSIYDPIKNMSINPMIKLPQVKDEFKPQIGRLHFCIDGETMQIRNGSRIRLTEHYPVFVSIKDSLTGTERTGIRFLKATFNGQAVRSVKFDELQDSKQGIALNGQLYNEYMDRQGLYRISGLKYLEGKNFLVVEAEDFFGNRSVQEFELFVNLDIKQ